MLTTIVLRLEGTVNGLIDQVVRQHQRQQWPPPRPITIAASPAIIVAGEERLARRVGDVGQLLVRDLDAEALPRGMAAGAGRTARITL